MSRQPQAVPAVGWEVESLTALDAWLDGGRPLAGLRLQDLDLTAREEQLLARDAQGVVVLGGTVSERLGDYLRRSGALVFPAVDGCPVNPYRNDLYRPQELYAGLAAGYAGTPDARTYNWYLEPTSGADVLSTMVRALHDDSINDALAETIAGRRVVGVMGGHAVHRGDGDYLQAAQLGQQLAASGALVLTGGGPGAMEAASLGAMLHRRPAKDVVDAAERLSVVASFRPDLTAWAQVAFEVRDRWHTEGDLTSIGIPTWFYGHEPSNVFADRVAKFFSNAVREDVLLKYSTAGVVVLPGAAGTVQEIFQAATQGYYAQAGRGIPMVLVDREHWTATLPVWPLLSALGAGREMANQLHLVDNVSQAAAVIAGNTRR